MLCTYHLTVLGLNIFQFILLILSYPHHFVSISLIKCYLYMLSCLSVLSMIHFDLQISKTAYSEVFEARVLWLFVSSETSIADIDNEW